MGRPTSAGPLTTLTYRCHVGTRSKTAQRCEEVGGVNAFSRIIPVRTTLDNVHGLETHLTLIVVSSRYKLVVPHRYDKVREQESMSDRPSKALHRGVETW